MANKIQIRRGLKTNLPVLDVGEPALCTDTKEVFVGNTGGNIALTNKETMDTHLGNYTLQIPYGASGGSANDYTVTLNPALASYTEGVAVAVKINVSNTGESTININGLGAKSIRDPRGNTLTAGKLTAGSIYTLRYNGTNFILQGEGASGNALASDLLSGKTASTDAGNITGTMTNRAGDNSNISSSVSGTILKLRAPKGYYDGVDDMVTINDTDFIAANIRTGINLFGISGTMPIKPDDYRGSPGNLHLTHGEMTYGGYFGRHTGICTGTALASAVGLSAGTAMNYISTDIDWCKIAYGGKIVFVARKPLRYGLSWNSLNAVGCATGEKQVTFNGITYICRGIKQQSSSGELQYVMYNVNAEGSGIWDNLTNEELYFNQTTGSNAAQCYGYELTSDYPTINSGWASVGTTNKDNSWSGYGWRPVLEVV